MVFDVMYRGEESEGPDGTWVLDREGEGEDGTKGVSDNVEGLDLVALQHRALDHVDVLS